MSAASFEAKSPPPTIPFKGSRKATENAPALGELTSGVSYAFQVSPPSLVAKILAVVEPPVAVQANAGGAARATPNWSRACAANSCVPPAVTLALAGVTTMVVSVWLTVTLTLLVAVRPAASRRVTVNA